MGKQFSLDDEVVVIVGSGAGGGTLGNELAQKGIDVVILEAGGRHEINDFENDEWPMFSKISWLDKRTTSGTWRVSNDFPNLPAWIVKAVGGSTTHWAGASLRFQKHEFKARTVYGDVGGANLLDWPITLDEMNPYYARAEFKMGTTGTNGIPRLPGNNNYKVLAAGAKKMGYKHFHTGICRSTRSRVMAVARANRSASASRAVSRVRSGQRSTPKFRRVKQLAISRFAPVLRY